MAVGCKNPRRRSTHPGAAPSRLPGGEQTAADFPS